MNKQLTIFLVTAGVFTTEAIVHYNLGRKFEKRETRLFELPKEEEFVKIVAAIFGFSIANTLIISLLLRK